MDISVNKWHLNRAGLLNYWYYDEEEFLFSDGRLLLRGNNGSGKSVTMQSLITVLLDGVKSPDRLDSFGTRSRRIEDYLLGEKEIVNRDERTGYLYLEYKRQNTEQYLTTGIGLQARRSGSLDFWGFVINDNRRLKSDLQLYKEEISPEDGSTQRIPLTRVELERVIGLSGHVVRSQNEYMELVNRYIFGFESIEQYQELMKLLIQLRSPKLSKDFKPSVIYEILNESLPTLSDEELRPLSDTIESMERTKLQIEQLVRDSQALVRLCRQYDLYNTFILSEKAELTQKTRQKTLKIGREAGELSQKIAAERRQLTAEQERQSELERELKVLEKEKDEFEHHDVFRAEKQKQDRERVLAEDTTAWREKNISLEGKKRQENEARQNVQKFELQVIEYDKQVKEILGELTEAAAETCFDEHDMEARAFMDRNPTFSFEVWYQNVRRYSDKLKTVIQKLNEQTQARKNRERFEQELSEEHRLLDQYRNEQSDLEKNFSDQRDKLLADFYQWRSLYECSLPMEQEKLRLVARTIQELYVKYSWNEVKAPVEEAYGRCIEVINRELGLKKADIDQLDVQEGQIRRKLNEWRNKEEPEPERLPDNQITRDELCERNIPFIPFYAAVEFRPEVLPEVRERIEAALTDIGLLDALILPEHRLRDIPNDNSFGAVIHPNPQTLGLTLTEYFYATPGKGVAQADIEAVLKSILVDESKVWTETLFYQGGFPKLNAMDGIYHLGILSGHAPHRPAAVYIGQQARQEFRRQQIASLEQKLVELSRTKEQLEVVCVDLRQQLTQAGKAMNEFLDEKQIMEIFNAIQAVIINIERQEKRVWQSDLRLKEVIAGLQSLREQLLQLSAGLRIPLGETEYMAAQESMSQYQQNLHQLELNWRDLENNQMNAQQWRERIAELITDVDGLKGELTVLNDKIKSLNLEIDQINLRLSEMGAEEFRERVREVTQRLGKIPEESKLSIQTATSLDFGIENDEKQLERLKIRVSFYEHLSGCWQKILDEELRLGLVYPSDQLPRINDILQQQGKVLKQENLDRTNVTERLSRSFHTENNVLMEYRMQLEPNPTHPGDLPEIAAGTDPDEDLAAELEKLLEKAQRQIITLDYEGRRLNPYQMQEKLESQITEQREILSEKDKELYEEVIMNSVGRIISRRIQAAQQWVSDMDQLMGQRDNSSGLKFKLEWKPRLAEHEEEMDTQDLIRLLHADPALLREDDLKKIVRHFQLRIEQAKRVSETADSENETTVSFQLAVKEVLDFRKWFQFKLFYEQSGIPWREMTDKAFFKFSGGEKAMAMYIPLFSAAFSRYQEARPDAPYIITLDEAFAGVDENNIRDTFALVEQLEFNYIMNSQALWGDYDVVPSLSIYELIRPKNAPYVTVVRFHWNGEVRMLIADDDKTLDNEDLVAATVGV